MSYSSNKTDFSKRINPSIKAKNKRYSPTKALKAESPDTPLEGSKFEEVEIPYTSKHPSNMKEKEGFRRRKTKS